MGIPACLSKSLQKWIHCQSTKKRLGRPNPCIHRPIPKLICLAIRSVQQLELLTKLFRIDPPSSQNFKTFQAETWWKLRNPGAQMTSNPSPQKALNLESKEKHLPLQNWAQPPQAQRLPYDIVCTHGSCQATTQTNHFLPAQPRDLRFFFPWRLWRGYVDVSWHLELS